MNEEMKALTTGGGGVDLSIYLDKQKFDHIHAVAGMFAQARMIPKHYQNSVPDCIIAINRALNMGLEISQFMEKTYPVGGKIGLESQLCIALANKKGVFKDVIQYKFSGQGDALTCIAFAETAATGVKCEASCSVQDAKDMGWWNRNGSPWPKQTKQMLIYRSATRLIKTYCPEVLMGLDSIEELRDHAGEIAPREKNITDEVNAELDKFKNGMADASKAPTRRKKAESKKEPETDDAGPPDGIVPEIEELRAIVESPEYNEEYGPILKAAGKTYEDAGKALYDGTGEKARAILDILRGGK